MEPPGRRLVVKRGNKYYITEGGVLQLLPPGAVIINLPNGDYATPSRNGIPIITGGGTRGRTSSGRPAPISAISSQQPLPYTIPIDSGGTRERPRTGIPAPGRDMFIGEGQNGSYITPTQYPGLVMDPRQRQAVFDQILSLTENRFFAPLRTTNPTILEQERLASSLHRMDVRAYRTFNTIHRQVPDFRIAMINEPRNYNTQDYMSGNPNNFRFSDPNEPSNTFVPDPRGEDPK